MRLFALLVLTASNLLTADSTVRPQLNYFKPFGGSGGDVGGAIAVDASGNVYVAGVTSSLDFPVKNALQPKFAWTPLRGSVDGGKTWFAPSIPETVNTVAGPPRALGVLYAGTPTTLYKSMDTGNTWTPLKLPLQANVNVVAVDPGTPLLCMRL